MGGEIPKQFMEIDGKSLLGHSLDAFLHCPGLQSVHIVANPNDLQYVKNSVGRVALPAPIPGGATRQESVRNALHALSHLADDALLLIHDAARPCILPAHILAVVEAAAAHGAATLATPLTDTLRRGEENGRAGEFVSRDGLWTLQTPQGFRHDILRQAHAAGGAANATDDTALVSALGLPVKLVQGSPGNIKVTMPGDLALAETLLKASRACEPRTGFGFDVHAFEEKPTGRPLMLCGVHVPHGRALAGHSDADVGLHALTDALLGAIGQGDIGTHFPPSDPAFKNMDSAIFLQKACDLLRQGGGRIANIDLTLICEEPKITPHRAVMIQRLAALLQIDAKRIGLKATTTEKLGFTGRGEGIAAQAVATILWPAE